jgi:quinol monooxygenase YgiN
MYPLISIWTILPGKEAEAIAALKAAALKVQAEEPDTLAYLVHTPDFTQPNLPTPPAGQVVFFEIYKDHDAFLYHLNGPTFTGFVKQYGNLFLNSNGSPYVTVEMMTLQGGFIRPGTV